MVSCEICGARELLKQEGVFLCQNCGIRYSVDEVKKLIAESVVETNKSYLVDVEDAENSLLEMGIDAYNTGNFEVASKAFDKLLELDPTHFTALYLKGFCALYRSKLSDIRVEEALNYCHISVRNVIGSLNTDKEISTEIATIVLEILAVADTLVMRVEEYYAKGWKSQECLKEYWSILLKCTLMAQYSKSILFYIDYYYDEDSSEAYIYACDKIIEYCDKICLTRQYVISTTHSEYYGIKEHLTSVTIPHDTYQRYNTLRENTLKDKEWATFIAKSSEEILYWCDHISEVSQQLGEYEMTLKKLQENYKIKLQEKEKYNKLLLNYSEIIEQNKRKLFGAGAKLRNDSIESSKELEKQLYTCNYQIEAINTQIPIYERSISILNIATKIAKNKESIKINFESMEESSFNTEM